MPIAWAADGPARFLQKGDITGTGGSDQGESAWGRISGNDLIGAASARLLAVGASRRDRLHALGFLGLLCDHADGTGTVRMPLDVLAGEFAIPLERARQLLELLVEVEVVHRAPGPIQLAGREPAVTGGLRLAGFLANVAAVLDDDAPQSPGRQGVGQGAAAVGGGPGGLGAPPPAPFGPARRHRERAAALLAAAAMVAVATLVPSIESTTGVRTVADSAPSNSTSAPGKFRPGPVTPSALDPGTASAPRGPGAAVPDQLAEQGSARPPTATEPRALAGAPGASAAGGTRPLGRGSSPPPAPRPALPSTPAPAPTPPQAPPPAGAPATPVPLRPPISCPSGAPHAGVDTVVVHPGGSAVVGAPAQPSVEVTGTLANSSTSDVVVEAFEVEITVETRREVVPGSPTSLAVPGEGAIDWTVTVPLPATPEVTPTAEADIVRWSWLDPGLAASCPA